MRHLIRALIAIAALSSFAFAQVSDPSAGLKELQEMQMKAYNDARANKTQPDFDAIAKSVRDRALEMVKGVDPEKLEPKDGVAWAQLFQRAGEDHHACMAAQRFLTTNPEPAEKYRAQSIMMVSCNALGEADMLQKTLASATPPPEYTVSLVSMAVDEYIDTIVSKKGPGAGLKTLGDIEHHVAYQDPKVYAKNRLEAEKRPLPNGATRVMSAGGNTKPMTDEEKLAQYEKDGANRNLSLQWSIVEKRGELMTSQGKAKQALKAMQDFVASVPADAPVRRSAEASILRTTMVNAPAVPLKFEKTIGDFTSIDSWKGKVVVVDFFAHWCGPCKASFPDMKQMYADLHSKGLEIVQVTRYYGFLGKDQGLSPEAEFTKMIDFKKQYDLPWPIVFGDNGNFTAYGVTGIPQTILVDRQGRVHKIDIGYSPESFKEFRKTIEELVAQR